MLAIGVHGQRVAVARSRRGVKTVEHSIADGGYTTRLECERGGGKEGEGD